MSPLRRHSQILFNGLQISLQLSLKLSCAGKCTRVSEVVFFFNFLLAFFSCTCDQWTHPPALWPLTSSRCLRTGWKEEVSLQRSAESHTEKTDPGPWGQCGGDFISVMESLSSTAAAMMMMMMMMMPAGPAGRHRCSLSSRRHLPSNIQLPNPPMTKQAHITDVTPDAADLDRLPLARTNRRTVVSLTSAVTDDRPLHVVGSHTGTI